MAKSKSTRSHAPASGAHGQARISRRAKRTRRPAPNEDGRDSAPGDATRAPRSQRPGLVTDEESGEQPRRPGGAGDVSFGNAGEAVEGPAR